MGKRKGKSNIVAASSKIVKESDAVDNKETAGVAVNSAFQLICRLCQVEDGPFLEIFDAEKIIAKKIVELMPFTIAETDELSHKICFRCSAKVEEIHEFIQKCIKTQENLNNLIGKKGPLQFKPKKIQRTLWEEKLNKSNMSNDDICDALIKKAMEGIKDIPLKPLPSVDKSILPKIPKDIQKPVVETNGLEISDSCITEIKNKPPTRSSRSKPLNEPLFDGSTIDGKSTKVLQTNAATDVSSIPKEVPGNKNVTNETVSSKKTINTFSIDIKDDSNQSTVEGSIEDSNQKETKPFNIMDHVCMIKVNGVGVLFQCKLCNRNFLKEEVVKSHACAKSGAPKITDKIDLTKNVSPPEPPKVPVVKYINTKIDENPPPSQPDKVKPKVGPASKVKHNTDNSNVDAKLLTEGQFRSEVTPASSSHPITAPSVQLPIAPNAKSRYKLIPGPNNTFTLVEEGSTPLTDVQDVPKNDKVKPKDRKQGVAKSANKGKKNSSPEIIDLDKPPNSPKPLQPSESQPYPVGLFQTVPHHSSTYPPASTQDPVVFTTPAIKKQSYTIVPTGNPSKLLISTKPQPIEEPLKKRQKRSKQEPVPATIQPKQPFTVTLEDNAHPKDAGFFTFINVDPLLQPSYVLPTDSIIQESQITTSTPILKTLLDNKDKDKDKYSCNMCNEQFSREKKLLTHIQSHYTQMDEEDQIREKNTRKRGRK